MQDKLDIKTIKFSENEIELPIFDNVEDGTEYRFSAIAYDFEEEDFLVRCDVTIKRMNEDEPDIWIDNIELWDEDEVKISKQEAFEIEQKLKKSLKIT